MMPGIALAVALAASLAALWRRLRPHRWTVVAEDGSAFVVQSSRLGRRIAVVLTQYGVEDAETGQHIGGNDLKYLLRARLDPTARQARAMLDRTSSAGNGAISVVDP